MLLNKDEVLRRLCALTTEVMEKEHKYVVPADCFCGEKQPLGQYQFDSGVLKFIEEAVHEKMERGHV